MSHFGVEILVDYMCFFYKVFSAYRHFVFYYKIWKARLLYIQKSKEIYVIEPFL